ALLRTLAWFAPDPVPLALLETGEAEKIWNTAADALAQDEGMPRGEARDIRDALGGLAAYSMLRWAGGDVAVHRVVQQIVRIRTPEAFRRAWLERAARLLLQGLPWNEAEAYDQRERMTALAPHADALVRATDAEA